MKFKCCMLLLYIQIRPVMPYISMKEHLWNICVWIIPQFRKKKKKKREVNYEQTAYFIDFEFKQHIKWIKILIFHLCWNLKCYISAWILYVLALYSIGNLSILYLGQRERKRERVFCFKCVLSYVANCSHWLQAI